MAGYWTDMFSFVGGTVRSSEKVFLVMSDDAIAARKLPFSSFVQWKRLPKGTPENLSWWDGGQTDWLTAGLALVRKPEEELVVVGQDGHVLVVELAGGKRHEERIVAERSSPKTRGPLRGVRQIDGHLFVVGMDRQVYHRAAPKAWSRAEAGLPSKTKGVKGFEAVDGPSKELLYAVGWDGEIWRCAESHWAEEKSPVDRLLVDVCCAGPDLTFACGREGLLVRRRKGRWAVLESGISDDIWSLAWFGEQLYASSMEAVFVLKKAGLERVKMGMDPPRTCHRLYAGEGVLCSIGAKDVMLFDGKHWTRIE